jgi:hypothetical protein
MEHFCLDDDPLSAMADSLRRLGHDAVRTGNKVLSDPRKLAFATLEERVFVTTSREEFEMLHEAWIVWSRLWGTAETMSHPGILIIPSDNDVDPEQLAQAIDELARRGEDLMNRLFRWRRATGWQEITVGP